MLKSKSAIPKRFVWHARLKDIPLALTRYSSLINSQSATLLPKCPIVMPQQVNAPQNVLKWMVVWRGSRWQFTFLYQSKCAVFIRIMNCKN